MALPVTEESAFGQTEIKWPRSNSNDTHSPQSSGNEPSSRSSAMFPEEDDHDRIEQDSDEYEGCVADEWQDTNVDPTPRSGGVTTGWNNFPPTETCDPGFKFSQSASRSDSSAPESKITQHAGEGNDLWAPGGGGDPLHDVLVWMGFANVDEQPSFAEAGGAEQSSRSGGAVSNQGEGYIVMGEEPNQPSPKVPSDEDARPRPPPYATHVSLMPSESLGTPTTAAVKSKSQELPRIVPLPTDTSLSKHDTPLSRCSSRPATDEVVDREEEEWLARKKLTGAIGRLVLYRKGQKPAEDILGLCKTRKGRLKVTALRPAGMASLAGVEVGDQLISINGQKPDESLLAEAVRTRLRAPATLIFMGFSGKLQAEVRVRQPDEPRCGLPAFTDVAAAALNHGRAKNAQIELCDAVVFQQATASLLLEVAPLPKSGEICCVDAEEPLLSSTVASAATVSVSMAMELSADTPAWIAGELQGADCQQKQQQQQQQAESSGCQDANAPKQMALAPRTSSRVYELQREDARRLVERALRANTPVS